MNIWILENSSGLTLYYYSFMKLKVNEHLVSGLLSALNHKDCPVEAKIGKVVLITSPLRGLVTA